VKRLFVDYAGATFDVVSQDQAKLRTAQLFVATLGASSYHLRPQASWRRALPRIGYPAHVRAFEFFRPVVSRKQRVCRQSEAGVTKGPVLMIPRSTAHTRTWLAHLRLQQSSRAKRTNQKTKLG